VDASHRAETFTPLLLRPTQQHYGNILPVARSIPIAIGESAVVARRTSLSQLYAWKPFEVNAAFGSLSIWANSAGEAATNIGASAPNFGANLANRLTSENAEFARFARRAIMRRTGVLEKTFALSDYFSAC
jgi:hypothetical protein